MSAQITGITIQVTVHDPHRDTLLGVAEARAFADRYLARNEGPGWVFVGADRTHYDEIVLRYARLGGARHTLANSVNSVNSATLHPPDKVSELSVSVS